jgi:hypothetical protein
LKPGAPDNTAWPACTERAKLVGGKLSVWSELDSGTEVELTIPGLIAYSKEPVARPSVVSGQRA